MIVQGRVSARFGIPAGYVCGNDRACQDESNQEPIPDLFKVAVISRIAAAGEHWPQALHVAGFQKRGEVADDVGPFYLNLALFGAKIVIYTLVWVKPAEAQRGEYVLAFVGGDNRVIQGADAFHSGVQAVYSHGGGGLSLAFGKLGMGELIEITPSGDAQTKGDGFAEIDGFRTELVRDFKAAHRATKVLGNIVFG